MRTKDYYTILGVPTDATEEAIRSAYWRLARKHHPDINPKDLDAQAQFREIAEAYEVLSDRTKRKLYDLLTGKARSARKTRGSGNGIVRNSMECSVYAYEMELRPQSLHSKESQGNEARRQESYHPGRMSDLEVQAYRKQADIGSRSIYTLEDLLSLKAGDIVTFKSRCIDSSVTASIVFLLWLTRPRLMIFNETLGRFIEMPKDCTQDVRRYRMLDLPIRKLQLRGYLYLPSADEAMRHAVPPTDKSFPMLRLFVAQAMQEALRAQPS